MRADHPPAAFSFQLSACGFSRLFGFRISDFFRPSAFSFQPSAFKLRFPGSLRVFCYLLVFGLLVLPARADSGVLVGAGEEWRALALSVGRGGPPGNWPSPGFEDSGWPTTIPGAWFGPEYALSPALPPPRPGRTFARKTFQVENPADVRWLWLRVGKETRWRAWLNGVEVTPRQVRLPRATSDPWMSWLRPSSSLTQFDLTVHKGLLKPGQNLLAAQLDEPADDGSPGNTWPVLVANFIRGPFLQSALPTGVTVVWRTALPTSTVVEYGPTPALGSAWTVPDRETNHVATLTGLTPDTLYYYRVGGESPEGSLAAGLETFRTFKASGAICFALVGDTGLGTPAQGAIATVLREAKPDFVMHAGDIIYRGFNDARADDRLFDYYQRQMKNVPWFFAVGNHDFNCCVGQPDYHKDNWALHASQYQRLFHLPTNPVTGTSHFYSFDHGDAHFAVLHHPWYSHYVFTRDKEQYAWLTNDLAHSVKPWKFLVLHSPIAHSGAHALDDLDGNGRLDQQEMMDLLLPVTQRYGVQVVFGAHEHNYERFVPTNGLHHVLSGGGGGLLYSFVRRHPGSAQFWKVYDCLRITLEGPTLLCEALNAQGEVFDSFSVTKDVPARRVWSSTWHSPLIETAPADDGDGNLNGQTFGFVGTPIPALAGQFSNLGQFFVNNDATHLYLGFKNALFYGNNNVFLFLESPRLPGVRSLAGLGNGVVDPTGQGVDGLDFLKNLSFSNFTPSVGCLLGDEYADGQHRGFARAGLALNLGQGVFRLDPAFSDVPGIRLQQFNRSPQTNSVPLAANGVDGEQNADFIELAIPLSALGDLGPGDLVKVGAVVGGAQVNLRTHARQLDSGFLGSSLTGQGLAPVALEGLSVRLAAPPASPARQ